MHRLFLAAALLGFVAPAVAQPDSYDAELVYALTGVRGDEDLMVGEAPASLLPFVPPGADVLATVTRPGFQRTPTVTVFARLAGSMEAAREAYGEPEVPGWTLRSRYEPRDDDEGGFVTDAVGSGPRTLTFDSDGEPQAVVRIHFRDRGEGGLFAEVEYRRLYPLEIRARAQPPQERRQGLDAKLPWLTPPPGGRQTRTGGGGGDTEYTTKALLEIDLTPEEVAAHYATLLAAGGWTAGGAAASDEVATSAWTRERDGGTVAAMFYARRVRPQAYVLHIHMIAADR
ncbi:hypothetical protein [Rubrivirga sp. IMCC45206]|uniref:hypothetical protein n=1 Tax=Rubrivirga sp. IMCC45206 TaxID=3391614 RepID=UPI00398FD30A